MDALAETETPVSQVELHKNEPITNPTHPLYPTVMSIAKYLNIKNIQGLYRNYPVTLSSRPILLAEGAVWAERGKDGNIVGEISFKDEGVITGNDPVSGWTRIEEVFHSLHQALNVGFRGECANYTNEFDQSLQDSARGISDAPILIEEAKEKTQRCLRDFSQRSGIEVSIDVQDPDDIRDAIVYLTKPHSYGLYPSTRLSAGQITRIHSALNELGLGHFDQYHLAQRYEDEQRKLERVMDPNGSQDTGIRNDILGVQRYIMQRLNESLWVRLEGVINKDGGENEILSIKEAFEAARVPIFTPALEAHLVQEKIDGLTPEETHQAVTKLLDTSPRLDDLQILNSLTMAAGEWGKNRFTLDTIAKAQGESANELDEIRGKIREDIDQNWKKIKIEDWRETLMALLRNTQRAAVGEAMVESGLFWFAEDLPGDPEARQKLLRNPEWRKSYKRAVLEALRDPSISILGEVDFDPQEIAESSQVATAAKGQALRKSKWQPATAAFVTDTERHLKHQKSGFGKTYEELILNQQTQIDRILLDGINGTTYPLGEIPPDTVWNEALSIAFAESYGHFERKMRLETEKHMRDLLIEPIAKVVCAQILGLNISSIVFPQNMMGGYSELLGSKGMKSWLNELWTFVKRAHTSDSEEMITDFLKAEDFEAQKAVLQKHGVRVA